MTKQLKINSINPYQVGVTYRQNELVFIGDSQCYANTDITTTGNNPDMSKFNAVVPTYGKIEQITNSMTTLQSFKSYYFNINGSTDITLTMPTSPGNGDYILIYTGWYGERLPVNCYVNHTLPFDTTRSIAGTAVTVGSFIIKLTYDSGYNGWYVTGSNYDSIYTGTKVVAGDGKFVQLITPDGLGTVRSLTFADFNMNLDWLKYIPAQNNVSGTVSNFGAIATGSGNISSGTYSFVGGGVNNRAQGQYAVALGGINSISSGQYSFVGAGYANTATAAVSFVGGGSQNIVKSLASSILGGYNCRVSSVYSSICGGNSNNINGLDDSGGTNSQDSFIGGGTGNHINLYGNYNGSLYSVIVGGRNNTVDGSSSFIGCGFQNSINKDVVDVYSSIINGSSNSVTGIYSSIINGKNCNITNDSSTIINGENITLPGQRQVFTTGKNLNAIVQNDTVIQSFYSGNIVKTNSLLFVLSTDNQYPLSSDGAGAYTGVNTSNAPLPYLPQADDQYVSTSFHKLNITAITNSGYSAQPHTIAYTELHIYVAYDYSTATLSIDHSTVGTDKVIGNLSDWNPTYTISIENNALKIVCFNNSLYTTWHASCESLYTGKTQI